MEVTAALVRDWVDYATMAVGGLTLVAIMVAGWLTRRQLLSMESARLAQALLHVVEVWNSPRLLVARHTVNNYGPDTLPAVIEKGDEENSELFFTLIAVAEFSEDLALARYRCYCREEDIWLQFANQIDRYYELYEKYIQRTRQQEPKTQYGEAYTGFEQLYRDNPWKSMR